MFEAAFPEWEPRKAQNHYYAMIAIEDLADGRHDPFFTTERGNLKRQGIAEQLGRMYEAGIIDKARGKELVETCKKDYENGRSVKEIEKTLRLMRQWYK